MPLKEPTPQGKAQRHERQVAKRYGGRVTAGSGNKSEKGDVRLRGRFRGELKSTEQRGYNLTRETWRKIAAAAYAAGEEPFMHLRFLSDSAVDLDLVVVPAYLFEGEVS